jgi:hypothetical protein
MRTVIAGRVLLALAIAGAGMAWAPVSVGRASASAAMTCRFDPYMPQSTFGDHQMHDVAAIAATDVWAVGEEGHTFTPLAYHWTGRRWRNVATAPRPTDVTYQSFDVVAAHASNDVWAFGLQATSGDMRLLIEHWDGSRWRTNTAYAFPGLSDQLEIEVMGAVAISASDAWVVGNVSLDTGFRPFALHWDGHAWSPTSLPDEAGFVASVASTSPTSVWAVGIIYGTHLFPAVFHWDGHTWSTARDMDPVAGSFSGVAAVGNGDIVAVGKIGYHGVPLAVMGPSRAWQVQAVPVAATWYTEFVDVATVSRTNIWAVGQQGQHDITRLRYPAAYRWNGSAWVHVRTPMDGTKGLTISAVAAVPGTRQVYVAGTYDSGAFGVPTDVFMARLC